MIEEKDDRREKGWCAVTEFLGDALIGGEPIAVDDGGGLGVLGDERVGPSDGGGEDAAEEADLATALNAAEDKDLFVVVSFSVLGRFSVAIG